MDPLCRPLPELLTEHLSHGVQRCCVFPGWKPDGQELLGSLDVVPGATGTFDDQPQDDGPRTQPHLSLGTTLTEEDR